MKVYVDVLFIINFLCDYLLLYSVKVLLRRNVKNKRILFSSLLGGLSLIVLFVKFSSIVFFLIKILLAVFMILIAFGYKDFFNNLLYFFVNSLVLGGFIYLVNLKIKNNLLKDELLNNMFLLSIMSPIIIYIYTGFLLKLKNNYSLKYKISIYIRDKKIMLNGYLDTGMCLIDPYSNKNIIITDNKLFNKLELDYLLVPYNTVDGKSMMKCFKPDDIYINNIHINNILIGVVTEKICLDGVDCLIGKNIMEEINEFN